ncbi:LexA-binding, inner membrane-associated putative hydrolase [anaerobic digester metagenome]
MEKIIDTFEKGFLMPYPVVHVLFFLFCVGIVAVYAITGPLYRRELCFSDARKLLLLAFVGGACTLFPDIMVVYNIIINNTMEHCSIGSIPTHSLLFSFTAILFGGLVGYAAFREFSKAVYMAIFAESAFLTHLLLDDIAEGGCEYLYPLYSSPISVFSMMDTGFAAAGSLFHYLMVSIVSVFCVFVVILMALFALDKFGFEFGYRKEK